MLRFIVRLNLNSKQGGNLRQALFSVASHVGNPCGHNFCGDCGWQWHHNAENVGRVLIDTLFSN